MVTLASTRSLAVTPVSVWTCTATLNLVALLKTKCCCVRSSVRLTVESDASESAEEFPEFTISCALVAPENPGPVSVTAEPLAVFDCDCIQGASPASKDGFANRWPSPVEEMLPETPGP